MNSPSQRNLQSADPLQYPADAPQEGDPSLAPDAPPLPAHEYDPVWVAQSEAEQREAMTEHDLERLEQIITSEHFRIRRQRAPNYIPPPPAPAPRKRLGVLWAIGTFVFLVLASALVALQVTDKVPLLEGAATDTPAPLARFAALLSSPQQPDAAKDKAVAAAPAKSPDRATPRLVVNGASADNPNEILLGVAVEGATENVTAVISGLAPGTTLSAGKPWGSSGWIVPAAALAATYLRPPAGFSGVMEYAVALQLPDNTVIERQSMRLEWTAPNPQPPASPQSPPPAAQTPPETRNLDAREIAAMIARGEELLNNGDIASARLLLRRAAEAGDARAAFALAASYDPFELKRLGVYGSTPDAAKARDWYEKARQYGSREAPRRLELLASQYR